MSKSKFKSNWPIIYACLISCFFTLFASALLPSLRLNYLAALIAFLILNLSLSSAIWLVFVSSLIIDFFSSTILGFHSLIGILSLTALFYLKRFFKNTTINLFILTLAASICIGIFQLFFFFLFEKSFRITFSFLLTDFFLLTFLDGLYALLVFSIPIYLIQLANQQIKLIKLKKAQAKEQQAEEQENKEYNKDSLEHNNTNAIVFDTKTEKPQKNKNISAEDS